MSNVLLMWGFFLFLKLKHQMQLSREMVEFLFRVLFKKKKNNKNGWLLYTFDGPSEMLPHPEPFQAQLRASYLVFRMNAFFLFAEI